MKLRSLHRVLAFALFAFVLSSAVTGVLRANARALYWKERPARDTSPPLTHPGVDVAGLFHLLENRFPEGAQVQHLELKRLSGRQVYVAEMQGSGARRILVDAASGEVLSPIGEDLAVEIARGFAPENAGVAALESIPAFHARKAREKRPAFRVRFNDALGTEVFVDRETGAPLAVLDRGRRFGLWIVKLHELDFAGLSQAALTVSGISLVVLTLTGLGLGLRRRAHSN